MPAERPRRRERPLRQFRVDDLPEAGPGGRVYEVLPQLTDPQLSRWRDPHLVALPPPGTAPGRLLVFLSGSYGRPERQVSIIEEAAALGQAAINLRYPNEWTVAHLCRRNPDPDCHEKVRLEIIDGRRRTDLLRLPPADCILNRLVRLLEWLARKRPDEGWGAFLREDAVRWEQVAVAGHSQGGGHAALMGKQFPLARVVMLGAPADAVGPADEPAPWLNRGGPTPPERYFGFAHGRDPGIERILAAWNRLDMNRFGPVVNVDGEAYPYHGSHCLITDLEARGGRYHGSVAVDRVIPRYRDGTPAYREVWRYLFALGEAVR